MEFIRYQEQWEKRAQQEEELFTRAPITKWEKKREKHLKKSRNGYAWFKINSPLLLFHIWSIKYVELSG